MDFVL